MRLSTTKFSAIWLITTSIAVLALTDKETLLQSLPNCVALKNAQSPEVNQEYVLSETGDATFIQYVGLTDGDTRIIFFTSDRMCGTGTRLSTCDYSNRWSIVTIPDVYHEFSLRDPTTSSSGIMGPYKYQDNSINKDLLVTVCTSVANTSTSSSSDFTLLGLSLSWKTVVYIGGGFVLFLLCCIVLTWYFCCREKGGGRGGNAKRGGGQGVWQMGEHGEAPFPAKVASPNNMAEGQVHAAFPHVVPPPNQRVVNDRPVSINISDLRAEFGEGREGEERKEEFKEEEDEVEVLALASRASKPKRPKDHERRFSANDAGGNRSAHKGHIVVPPSPKDKEKAYAQRSPSPAAPPPRPPPRLVEKNDRIGGAAVAAEVVRVNLDGEVDAELANAMSESLRLHDEELARQRELLAQHNGNRMTPHKKEPHHQPAHSAQFVRSKSGNGGEKEKAIPYAPAMSILVGSPEEKEEAKEAGEEAGSDDEQLTECAICFENFNDAGIIQALIIPCGHACACLQCSELLLGKECPMCRIKVLRVVDINGTAAMDGEAAWINSEVQVVQGQLSGSGIVSPREGQQAGNFSVYEPRRSMSLLPKKNSIVIRTKKGTGLHGRQSSDLQKTLQLLHQSGAAAAAQAAQGRSAMSAPV